LVKVLAPTFGTVGSAVWIAYTYFDRQREAHTQQLLQLEKENKTRMLEARKPFNDRQLALYSEVSQVTGRIVTSTNFSNGEWAANVVRFWQLFWTELSMVEDERVKQAMQRFGKQLNIMIEAGRESEDAREKELKLLQQRGYQLASALRASIEDSWLVNLSSSPTQEDHSRSQIP
jgi:predicted DNA-binding WGR domain protein